MSTALKRMGYLLTQEPKLIHLWVKGKGASHISSLNFAFQAAKIKAEFVNTNVIDQFTDMLDQ